LHGCLVGDYGCRPIVLDAGEWTIRVGKRTDDMGGLMVPINEAPDHPDTSLIATYRTAAPDLAREVLRLSAIVERLPTTADGVPKLEGDIVYSPSGRRHRVRVDRHGGGDPIYYVPEAINVGGDWRDLLVSECYSTHQAAEAARHLNTDRAQRPV
jgi:hypothetical protein